MKEKSSQAAGFNIHPDVTIGHMHLKVAEHALLKDASARRQASRSTEERT